MLSIKTCHSLILLLFTYLPLLVQSQVLHSFATKWSNSFVEWHFYTEDEELEGELNMKWLMQNDWTEWDYRIGETFGGIKRKWKDNPNEWELRGRNRIVTARTIWTGDMREWRITDNNRTLTLRSKWGNQTDEWELRDRQYGKFYMYTRYERDPREWEIVDELKSEITFEMKMMLAFIVIFHSSPKI